MNIANFIIPGLDCTLCYKQNLLEVTTESSYSHFRISVSPINSNILCSIIGCNYNYIASLGVR